MSLRRSRFRRVRRFLFGVLLHAFWWDVICNRPGLRRWRPDPLERWVVIARRYRELAVELGGVLIKLGQFLSARLDVIPPEVASELAELQDEVPPVTFESIHTRIREGLGASPDEAFAWLDPAPRGAASLAQVHGARLADGRDVAVKVLRPGIEDVVETDLAAFASTVRWVKLWRRLRDRVDVDWLYREFAAVTRRELDLEAEGHSIERFARDMADQPDVLLPAVVWSHTAATVLTMDNVAGIKITDEPALDAAGVDRRKVAERVYALLMRQLFETHFVHADPHPGNLFIHPRPPTEEAAPAGFRIAYVDFGMTTEIPQRLRASLREFVIGLGTRDARRMVRSYVEAGTLLPGADVERLVEAHEAVLGRFWGVPLSELRDAALAEGEALYREFRDLIYDAPVQLQVDMVFSLRAVGLVAGLCSRLDPAFDPWQATLPFARRFAREAAPGVLKGAGGLLQGLLRLPGRLERALDRAERGEVRVEATWSRDARRQVATLTGAVRRLGWMVAAGALIVSGAVLRSADPADPMAWGLLAAAAVTGLLALLRR